MLAVCCRLGLAGDARVRLLAECLVASQWQDGGWNCDEKAKRHRSSFNGSVAPMWGSTSTRPLEELPVPRREDGRGAL